MTKLLTVPEAAEMLRVSERTVRTLVAARILPVVRIGRRTLVAPESLQAFATAHENPARENGQ